MAWSSFNSPSAINLNSSSKQYLSYEPTSSDKLATEDPSLKFPFSTSIHVDGSTLSDYNLEYHSNSITPLPSSQFVLHTGHNPLHDVLEKNGDLEHAEKAMFSGSEWLGLSPHTSTSVANGSFLPKKSQHRHIHRKFGTHRVTKKRFRAPPIRHEIIFCLKIFLTIAVS